MVNYEIGVVYSKGPRLFIAVDARTLVGCSKGKVSEIKPQSQYTVVRSISVEKLCEKWDISLREFDALMSDYMAPPQTAIKTRPRGTRRTKDDDEEYWKRHRTGRIARPQL